MSETTRVIKCIPKWLLAEYLEEIGGQQAGDEQVRGNGWVVYLKQIDPFQRGSLCVGQVRMTIEGEPEAVEQLMILLAPKIMRAGG
jgi:hypothetical protein